MTRLQQSGLLALFLLLAVAGIAWFVGSHSAPSSPVEAAVSLETEDLLAVRPIPPASRRLSPVDFARPSPRHPLDGGPGPNINEEPAPVSGPGLGSAEPIDLDPRPAAEGAASLPSTGGVLRRIRARYGDSLRRIARRELGSESRWKELAVQNGIQAPYTIRQGQELVLPPASRPRSVAPDSSRPSASRLRHYTVHPGELPSEVSKAVYGDSKYWELILRHNGIRDARRMRAGQVLEIPPLPR